MIGVVSKFRPAFWVRQFINYFGALFLIGLCVYYSLDKGHLDYRNALFGIACIGTIGFLFYIFMFLFGELKQLTVTETGITINYLLSRKTINIVFTDIKKSTVTLITERRGVGRSDGYYELELELANGESIVFNEDQFENYSELKNAIYKGQQN